MMISPALWIPLAVVVALGDAVIDLKGDEETDASAELRNWKLSLRRYQNDSGHWADFSFTGDDLNTTATNDGNMNVTATVFGCGGKKMIRLHATIKDPRFNSKNPEEDEPEGDRLRFHERTADNAKLANRRLTAMKIDPKKHGVVLSHRILKPNETFEVKIDQIVPGKRYANAIGVTTHSPNDIEFPNHMNSLKSGTWMLYHTQVWHNGSQLKRRYTRNSLDKLKVGDRVGVMRTDAGVLHFFINGVDLGPAASDIPQNVYGVYEFYGDTAQVTIVHSS